MKKVLVLTAVIAMFAASAFAQEISFKNFKVYGEGSIIGMYEDYNRYRVNNYNKSIDNYSTVYNQFLLGVTFDIHPNVQAAVALGYEPRWGDSYLDGKDISDSNDKGYLNQVRVVEANITLNNVFDVYGLKAKLGRQFYGDEDSSVMFLGVRHYNAEPGNWLFGLTANKITSLDALSGCYENGDLKINAIYGVFSSVIENGDSNISLSGVDVKYTDIILDTLNGQAYWYELENANKASGSMLSTDKYGIIGVKPMLKKNDFKASLEVAFNYGAKTGYGDKYSSNLIKADAAYEVKDLNLIPRAAYVLIGGYNDKDGFDKPFFNAGNYTPGLIFGQEDFDGSDFEIINGGADYAWNQYVLSFDYYNFSSRDTSAFYGEEIDLFIKYRYTENIEIFAGIAHMFASMNYNNGQDISKGMLGITYKIK